MSTFNYMDSCPLNKQQTGQVDLIHWEKTGLPTDVQVIIGQ